MVDSTFSHCSHGQSSEPGRVAVRREAPAVNLPQPSATISSQARATPATGATRFQHGNCGIQHGENEKNIQKTMENGENHHFDGENSL